MDVKDQAAVVTGAGRGIGRAIAEGLAVRGVRVICCDIDGQAAQRVAEHIQSQGGSAHPVAADVAEPRQVEALFSTATGMYGGVDILVNNAGIAILKPLIDYTEDDYEKLMAVNVTGVFLCTQAAARRMIPRRRGTIVNISSISAFAASRTPEAIYDTTKGGVRQFTVSAAAELAPFGITVNAVAPGTTRTELNARTLATADQVSRAIARIPVGRIAVPEEIAGPVIFLCSAEARYVTGQVLVADGGQLLY